jgi:hypothetical protein
VPTWAQFYARPTIDADSNYPIGAPPNYFCSTGVAQPPSPSMSNVYAGKTGPGPTGSPGVMGWTSFANNFEQQVMQHVFYGIAGSSTADYTVSINHKYTVDTSIFGHEQYAVWYSLDNGSTWTKLVSGGAHDVQTNSFTVPSSIPFSNLQIAVCDAAGIGATSSALAQLYVYDLWISYSAPAKKRNVIWWSGQ